MPKPSITIETQNHADRQSGPKGESASAEEPETTIWPVEANMNDRTTENHSPSVFTAPHASEDQPSDPQKTPKREIKTWTDAEVDEVTRLFAIEKLAAPEIAERIGRTAGSVAVKLTRLGLSKRSAPRKDTGKRKLQGAVDWEEQMELDRRARIKLRNCMTCGVEFSSEGPHNRRCNSCRSMSDDEGYKLIF